MTEFAKKMEGKARKFIDRLIDEGELAEKLYRDDRNFKPWYSPRDLIDRAAKEGKIDRVLIGVNPAGNPRSHDQTTFDRLWEHPINIARPFNAFLDESWKGQSPGKEKLQVAVQDVFRALCCDGWKSLLRNTVCFNVCPIRTDNAQRIPTAAWDASVKWCLEVLECLRPTRIICFAIFDKGGSPARRSPWHAIDREYQIEHKFRADVKRQRNDFPAFVLAGEASIGALSSCEVIGVPHLSYHHCNNKMYDALGEYLAQC